MIYILLEPIHESQNDHYRVHKYFENEYFFFLGKGQFMLV